MTDWIFDDSIDPLVFEGFVYLITHLPSGRLYVGKKSVWQRRRGKKKAEAKWRDYWSSSTYVKELVKRDGKEAFRREVLHWCLTKTDLSYMEVEEQISRDVLRAIGSDGERLYLNRNIMNRFFCNIGNPSGYRHSDDARLAISAGAKGRVKTEAERAKLSAANKGKRPSPACIAASIEARADLPPWNKGIVYSDEERSRIAAATKSGMASDEVRAKLATGYARRRQNSRSKMRLDDNQVREVRATDEPLAAIAKRYNIDSSTLSRVRSGKLYSFVLDQPEGSTAQVVFSAQIVGEVATCC